jgi:MFS family permease
MSALADTSLDAAAGDRLARRNALILALAQGLAGANNTVIVGTAGIIGGMLADKSLATVPVSTFVLGMWAGTLPTGAIARRFGRLAAFEVGTLCGMLAGLVCATAVIVASFPLLCLGTIFGGLYASAHQSYRFAAADTASDAFKPKAISWVLAGGVIAGVFGPQLIIVTKDILPHYLFAASYLAQAVVAVIAAGVLLLVRIPKAPPGPSVAGKARSLSEIFRQPRLIAAVICGVASYAMMNLIMTAAPVAMVDCNHSVSDAALGLQWHVMAMYAPSFFTGTLIARFGNARVIIAGLAIIGAGAGVGLLGITIAHFWTDLILVGIGWNFAFVGATAMVTECHLPHERNKVQAVNDFLVFGTMAVGSFSSGQLLAHYGWPMVNQVVIPFMFLATALLVLVSFKRPRSEMRGA